MIFQSVRSCRNHSNWWNQISLRSWRIPKCLSIFDALQITAKRAQAQKIAMTKSVSGQCIIIVIIFICIKFYVYVYTYMYEVAHWATLAYWYLIGTRWANSLSAVSNPDSSWFIPCKSAYVSCNQHAHSLHAVPHSRAIVRHFQAHRFVKTLRRRFIETNRFRDLNGSSNLFARRYVYFVMFKWPVSKIFSAN